MKQDLGYICSERDETRVFNGATLENDVQIRLLVNSTSLTSKFGLELCPYIHFARYAPHSLC